jgi:signal recognition particle GTPase
MKLFYLDKQKEGNNFNLFDLKDQLDQIKKIGGINSIIEKMPGMISIDKNIKNKINDKELIKNYSIINSMTNKEKQFPLLFKQKGAGSRKVRISKGSGTGVEDINKVLIDTLSAPQFNNLLISSTPQTPPPTVKGTKHFFEVFLTTS